jgi:type IV pilus assembly protein PilM
MARTRIGVDVGSTAVRVAEVAVGDVPVVVRAAQVPLPAGAVEAGEVRQPEVVTDALKNLWSQSGVKGKQVYLGVGNQRVVVREVSLPWLPEKELRDSLGFQVQEFIPMAADDAVLDFDPLGEMDQGGRRMQRILLVAANKSMIGALVEAAIGARLDPKGVDLTPFAAVRAIGSADENLDLESPGDEAVVDVGAHVTSICVHDRGITRFVRILPSGGRDVTLAIARGLGIDDEIAEALKRGEPVVPPPPEEAGPAPELPSPDEVRRLALSRAGSFVDEIRSSLEFYAAQVPGARIARVVVTGGGSRLDGFLELLQERIPVEVERGRLFEHVKSELDLSAEAAAEAESVLAVAVGLAMGTRKRS